MSEDVSKDSEDGEVSPEVQEQEEAEDRDDSTADASDDDGSTADASDDDDSTADASSAVDASDDDGSAAVDAPEDDEPQTETGEGAIPDDRPDYMTAENFLSAKWRGHDIAVSGDWTIRWLFLTPTYTLWVDGQPVEKTSGPRPSPSLDAVLEDASGEAFHLNATLTSIVGYKPPCKITVEDEIIAEGDIRVANFLNPFLVLFILLAVCLMVLIGPDVLSEYLP